ncbi:hypothetical protein ACFVIM_26390 [Streptomyces sp. NPDC057638]|uniref:hypothetical protein n=1 Tax=Streptomyces sp. NPDC057638 TaxID=3346190 RepID=UPI003675F6B8
MRNGGRVLRVGVTGHRHLPAEVYPHISAGIRDALNGHGGGLEAFSCLAVGADQLFADIALDCGAELTAVIPSGDYTDDFTEPGELAGFLRLRRRATREVRMGYARSSGEAYYAAGAYIADRCDRLVAVWDGEPARGVGGTADIVRYARQLGKPVTILWQSGLIRP